LNDGIKLPYFSAVQGNGIEATRAAGLDALLLTWMQAERFGITPVLEPHTSKVFPTRAEDVRKGYPPFIVAGVMLTPSDSREAKRQLEIVIRAMLRAVDDFYATSGIRIHRIGTIPENLLLKDLHLTEASRIITSVFADAGFREAPENNSRS
jgi:hypothetical protein